jgi:hypothetical protein
MEMMRIDPNQVTGRSIMSRQLAAFTAMEGSNALGFLTGENGLMRVGLLRIILG